MDTEKSFKPLVIYHANCADGYGAAFATWLKLGDEAEYLPWQYGKDFLAEATTPLMDREIYILDFSLPREQMDWLFANAKRAVWLDHHATSRTYAEEKCGGYIESRTERHSETYDIVHDNNKSGAYLAWEYFHPDTEVPMLIQHIDDYDRWQFKLKGTKEISKALWSFAPWSFSQWQEIVDDDQYGSMWSQGAAILRAHEQNVQSVVKGSARECEINFDTIDGEVTNANLVWNNGGYYMLPGLVANCPPFLTSDVGHELATQSGTFGLCWTLSKTGLTANCSLRSNGEYDVSAIAKAFGGGGHRNASGMEIPLATLIGWLK